MDAATSRRDRIAELTATRGFIRVRDAARLLRVSEVTIRGDLSILEAAGTVIRIHGGAMPPRGPEAEATIEQSVAVAAEAKRDIGVAAAALVSSGQSVILDVGSTALAVAVALVQRTDLEDVSVITNGLSIALALEVAVPRFTVVVTGGTLRTQQHSLVNPGASTFLESLHADLAFIGCNGVDADRGVTNVNFPEAEVKRRMMLSSKRSILIADAEKLGQSHLGVIAATREFDLLITSEVPDREQLRRISQTGLEVHIAPPTRPLG